MFERYTEKARRVIFFARYEASQFGASQIEAEHILLGLIREDKNLTDRFLRHPDFGFVSIRKEIEDRTILRPRISTNIDLPLSSEAKRALTFAAEESEILGNRHIGTEHLLLGLLREENTIAAEILNSRGLRISELHEQLLKDPAIKRPVTQQLTLDEVQPTDRDEKWMREVAEVCIEKGLFTQEDLASGFEQVAALRQFRADAEALLRLLAAKGLVDLRHLSALAFELRDEKKLAEFIRGLRTED